MPTPHQEIEAASALFTAVVAAHVTREDKRHAALYLGRLAKEAALEGIPAGGPPGTDGPKTTGMVLESAGGGTIVARLEYVPPSPFKPLDEDDAYAE